MSAKKVILELPYLLMKIRLATEVPELPNNYQFTKPKSTTDLGFIRCTMNPMARQARKEDAMLTEIFKN